MSLDYWQVRLSEHFSKLHETRSLAKGNWPIYGLEHGLTPDEILALEADVRTDVASKSLSRENWLPWIVYSSELGYKYDGLEYWQTFGQSTPNWEYYGDRYWIRHIFLDFHKMYGGAKPFGNWADHFSIICWPITHAILPLDLQRQLARILYEVSYRFDKAVLETPTILGSLIAERAWTGTSRFQNFAGYPTLVGQISAALLLQSEQGFQSLILPLTLERIAKDLDEVRQARDWLRKAIHQAQQVHMRGLSKSKADVGTSVAKTVEHGRQQVEILGLEPHLRLNPTELGPWEVWLETPDCSHLMDRFPQVRSALTESRCLVSGSSGRPLARGRILYGPQYVRLHKWPKPNEVLMRFDPPCRELDFLLRTECLLRGSDFYLFKVGQDGVAHELRNMTVRVGQDYILVTTTGAIQPHNCMTPISLECEGAFAALLKIPNIFPPDLVNRLRSIGIEPAKLIEVWPVGLMGTNWDGEGRLEWLASESLCLATCVYHTVDMITLSIDEHSDFTLNIKSPTPGEPVFIELPMLPTGTYRLKVSVNSFEEEVPEESGQLEIAVREPRSWRPGMSTRMPLLVSVEPLSPTLEQLWEGHAEIEIDGPVSRSVSCSVRLLLRRALPSSDPLASVNLPPLPLPVRSDAWRKHFDENVRQVQAIMDIYDSADLCEINITGDELGSFSLRCEREFTPLRWMIRRDRAGYHLRLQDESGGIKQPRIFKREFVNPNKAELIKDNSFQTSFVLVDDGLYYAETDEHTCAVILPPTVLKSLHALNMEPEINGEERSVEHIMELLDSVEIWASARLPGDFLSVLRQQKVQISFVRHIVALICGSRWEQAEKLYEVNTNEMNTSQSRLFILRREISKGAIHHQVGEQLSSLPKEALDMMIQDRVEALSTATRQFVQIPPGALSNIGDQDRHRWLCEFALRLASFPKCLNKWSGSRQNVRESIDALKANPLLERAARFFVLAIESQLPKSTTKAGQIYGNWSWE